MFISIDRAVTTFHRRHRVDWLIVWLEISTSPVHHEWWSKGLATYVFKRHHINKTANQYMSCNQSTHPKRKKNYFYFLDPMLFINFTEAKMHMNSLILSLSFYIKRFSQKIIIKKTFGHFYFLMNQLPISFCVGRKEVYKIIKNLTIDSLHERPSGFYLLLAAAIAHLCG